MLTPTQSSRLSTICLVAFLRAFFEGSLVFTHDAVNSAAFQAKSLARQKLLFNAEEFLSIFLF